MRPSGETTKTMRQHARVEVDEKPDVDAREAQVSQLEHDAVIDDDVEGVGAVEAYGLVDDGQRSLAFERQTRSCPRKPTREVRATVRGGHR